jgi:tripartite-type tricarboxylate transporter receptor subunit TctC
MMTGINLVHVPYRGGYLPDLLNGQVQVVFGTYARAFSTFEPRR